jgi:hypothetical protein
MATTRKRKAARAAPARKKPPARRKPARESSGEPALARVLAIPVEPQWLPAIRANLQVNLRLAALVAEFDLPDEAEPAPVFRA